MRWVRTITAAGRTISLVAESERFRGMCLFVVITDGLLLTPSREYTGRKIKGHGSRTQHDEFSWTFSFIWARIQDAWRWFDDGL